MAMIAPPAIQTVLLVIKETSEGFGEHPVNSRSATNTVDTEKSWLSVEKARSLALGSPERGAAGLTAGHEESHIHRLPGHTDSGQGDIGRCLEALDPERLAVAGDHHVH